MQRPASLTVFGILNLLFAALGCGGSLFGALVFVMPEPQGTKNPVLELIRQNPAYGTFLKVLLVLGIAWAMVLLLAGVGLLMAKMWGRHLSIAYALYAILIVIAGAIGNYYFLVAPLMEKAAKAPAGPENAAAIGAAVGGLAGGCFGLIYPVLLLIFMFRPNVVAFLRQPDMPGPFQPGPFQP